MAAGALHGRETRAASLLATIIRLNERGLAPTKAAAIVADDPRGVDVPSGSRVYRYGVIDGLIERGLLTDECSGPVYALRVTAAGRVAIQDSRPEHDLVTATRSPGGVGRPDRLPGP